MASSYWGRRHAGKCLHTCTAVILPVEMSHLSWPSLFLDFLLRLAILDLWVVLRAGPTLIDVFSNGVAEMDTLVPL